MALQGHISIISKISCLQSLKIRNQQIRWRYWFFFFLNKTPRAESSRDGLLALAVHTAVVYALSLISLLQNPGWGSSVHWRCCQLPMAGGTKRAMRFVRIGPQVPLHSDFVALPLGVAWPKYSRGPDWLQERQSMAMPWSGIEGQWKALSISGSKPSFKIWNSI